VTVLPLRHVRRQLALPLLPDRPAPNKQPFQIKAFLRYIFSLDMIIDVLQYAIDDDDYEETYTNLGTLFEDDNARQLGEHKQSQSGLVTRAFPVRPLNGGSGDN
jgi:hypothetical protein